MLALPIIFICVPSPPFVKSEDRSETHERHARREDVDPLAELPVPHEHLVQEPGETRAHEHGVAGDRRPMPAARPKRARRSAGHRREGR